MRLRRENSTLVMSVAWFLLWRSSTHVNTLWLRLLSLLRRVSPVCLFSAPLRIRAMASSTAQQAKVTPQPHRQSWYADTTAAG